jgi:hypothetical protein
VRRLQVALVASVLAIPSWMFAQSASVVRPLRRGVEREAVRLANAAVPASAAQGTQRQRNWAGRHSVFLGTMIGLGAGPALSLPNCAASSDYTCAQLGAFYGGIFAGVGAGVGGVVSVILR